MYVCIDIEGTWNNPVEVALAVVDRTSFTVVDAFCTLVKGPFSPNAEYSHCISHENRIHKGIDKWQLQRILKNYITSKTILFANGIDDIAKFLKDLCITWQKLIDIGMPDWAGRSKQSWHLAAKDFQMNGNQIGNAHCNYNQIHNMVFMSRKPTTEGRIARNVHGKHCALTDVMELIFFIRETK